ncbi:hypothetical protein SUDANB120_06588 (plasmid) [Streptomyces sp. enrichment culture]|uniref:Uncharacterized protein n=2 Tax=Streptomyces TaxID=1883 RepID=A0A344UAW7_9ACTN|nr:MULTISPECIES: hypothetical protein [Streptomyces]AXE28038.1 hypothetical protein C0216_31540 [Streptomyces globosus]MBD3575302.1 hypothetical protein [Streptomyces sp. KD18]GGS92179.1 hypothetical protein GCM10010286_16170 [Streptomyces toxytricini]
MSVLIEKVNAGAARAAESPVAPVMATPAAFTVGFVGGAKATAIIVAAAGVGAAVKACQK